MTLPAAATTDTPFPVLGAGNVVFVVAPSYDSSQMVMWKSTDGGASFGPAFVGPSNAVLADDLDYTDTCNVAVNLDDVLPLTPTAASMTAVRARRRSAAARSS